MSLTYSQVGVSLSPQHSSVINHHNNPRYPLTYFGIVSTHRQGRLLHPAEIIDVLKYLIIGTCCYAMSYVDTSMLYHMIKSQSVIKLYLMYNMIEVADRLFSAFGKSCLSLIV